MSQAPITARATEEGRIQHHDHAFTAQDGQLQQQQQKHKRGWLHHRKDQRKKEKIESKLPGVMADTKDAKQAERRLKIKNEIVAAVGEFVGTFLFLFFSFGIATVAGQQSLTAQSAGQVQSTGGDSTGTTLDPSQLLYSSLGFGFSLAVNAWLFFRVSGGLFNPAVAFGLLLTGSLSLVRFPILVVMEVAGALSAAGLAQVLVPGGIQARARLAGSTTVGQGFVIEMLMTSRWLKKFVIWMGVKRADSAPFDYLQLNSFSRFSCLRARSTKVCSLAANIAFWHSADLSSPSQVPSSRPSASASRFSSPSSGRPLSPRARSTPFARSVLTSLHTVSTRLHGSTTWLWVQIAPPDRPRSMAQLDKGVC